MTSTAPSNNSNDGGGTVPVLPRPEQYASLLKPLLVVFVAAVLALFFILLGSEVREGDTSFFDMQVLELAQALRAGHSWLAEAMRDLSGLGSTVVTLLVSGCVALHWVCTMQRTSLVAGPLTQHGRWLGCYWLIS